MLGIPTPETLAAKALCALFAALLLLSAGAYGGYRWEKGDLEDLKLADANALIVATKDAAKKQADIDASGKAAAVDEAFFQGKLAGTVINLQSGAPLNVTIAQDQEAAASDHAGCVTYGFYRMLAAGERGVTADALALPDGAAVDDCTADAPSDLAAKAATSLAEGFGYGHQLNDLIAELKRQEAIRLGKSPADAAESSGLSGEASAQPKEAAP